MNLFDVYPLLDVTVTSAKGSFVYTIDNEKYLDVYGGHAVIAIGHSHPHYISKLTNQLQQIGFYSNSVEIPIQKELAEKLGKLSGYESYQLFLCNSGAEANENAIKLASFHNRNKKIISFSKSFHGRTAAAVAATDNKSISAPVNYSENFIILPFNDCEIIKETFEKHKDIAAVIIEGIQGDGGVQIPTPEFLSCIQILCQQNNALLILDEIQSGYGRSGKFFAHQYFNIKPDIITIAKGMGNGFPVAGVLISPDIKPKHGLLGTTFGGNYLACAASLAVLEVIENENLIENATELGDWFVQQIQGFSKIKEIRHLGLMIGIELHESCAVIRQKLYKDYHILTGNASNPNVLRILPPLTITKQELQLLVEALQIELN